MSYTGTNARTWIERLNEFKSTQMRGWDLFEREVEENDDIDVWSTGGGYTNRFGEDLLMYGMRMSPGGKRVNPGVVYVFTSLLSLINSHRHTQADTRTTFSRTIPDLARLTVTW